MALVFLIRDLLQVLSGGQIETLSFSSSAEELLSKLPKAEEIVQAEASQDGAHQVEPAMYREGNGLVPRVTARKLDENLTATLKERARREGTTSNLQCQCARSIFRVILTILGRAGEFEFL